MLWFKHDSNAHTDAKLKKVKHKYGITGYGLYWYCIELIAQRLNKNNVSFQLEEDAELIGLEWNLDQLKVQEIMQYFVSLNLFSGDNNGRIFCLKLAKRLDDTNAKNPEIRQIISALNNNSEMLGDTPTNSEKLRAEEIRLEEIRREKKRLDKDLEKKKKTPTAKSKKFIKPTVPEIAEYCKERNNTINPEQFFDHNEAKGWLVGKAPMKDWKASIRTWERNGFNNHPSTNQNETVDQFQSRISEESAGIVERMVERGQIDG